MAIETNQDKVYRFKFTDDMSELLLRFATIHNGDDREDYNDAWVGFLENNAEAVLRETEYLNGRGYDGSVENKMYVSARYYYSKKIGPGGNDEENRGDDTEERPKRAYNHIDPKVLATVNQFIAENNELKPSEAYEQFCEQHGDICPKKTFKNGCYVYKSKNK
jgi:hypothetical protein